MDYIQDELLWPDEFALAAEVRAVEEGHLARVLPDGSILVKADSRPGSYLVRIRRVTDGVVGFACTCPSGTYRADRPVPCKHAALAGRRLEREGLASFDAGRWWVRHRAALRAALAATAHRGAERRADPAEVSRAA
jgi:hypothetical protein